MRLTRLMSAALAVAAVAGVVACGSDALSSPTDPNLAIPGAVLGSYGLLTINGQPLPAETRHDAAGTASVTGGVLTLGGGTFFQNLTVSETTAAGQTTSRTSGTQGSFSMRGEQIHFQGSDGGSWDGTWAGNRIAYSITGNNGPVTFVFIRT
ncbi:hypothetical protein [Longimicrobium sp.]|uniref:hypothetical protein n=1 Tax=Longimicrobium sp. TaxID=2029185 RepID=UPI002BD42BAF|nr:hypothetical protein [Longimicrobium sp.]HSU15491.1 hypothetical protein [Longimicrobium sp.]